MKRNYIFGLVSICGLFYLNQQQAKAVEVESVESPRGQIVAQAIAKPGQTPTAIAKPGGSLAIEKPGTVTKAITKPGQNKGIDKPGQTKAIDKPGATTSPPPKPPSRPSQPKRKPPAIRRQTPKVTPKPAVKQAPKAVRKAPPQPTKVAQKPKIAKQPKPAPKPKPPITIIPPVQAAPAPEPTETETTTTKKLENPKLEKATFLCGVDGNLPATIAEISEQEKIPVILWQSEDFKEAGYDPETRCKQVSARFEAYKKDGFLVYLTTGKLNGQPVICITSKEDGDCGDGIPISEGLLYTLQPSKTIQETEKTLEQLFARLQGEGAAAENPVTE